MDNPGCLCIVRIARRERLNKRLAVSAIAEDGFLWECLMISADTSRAANTDTKASLSDEDRLI